MKVFAATAIIFGLLFSAAVLSLPSVSEAREIPPRAISPDAVCRVGEINGHHGFICRDGNLDFFCTEPRTVCWPIFPPGPYSRGYRGSLPAAPQPAQLRASQ